LTFGAHSNQGGFVPSSKVAHPGPKPRLWTYFVGRAYLKVAGWKIEGELPDSAKGVLIAAPHTSGWDLPYMLAVAWTYRLDLNWIGKHTLFRGPIRGSFLRWLGGIAVDRRSRNGVVAQIVDHFDDSDAMALAIAPAGTRGQAKHWKSGFYHIAHGAQVPIICGFLDFKRKVGGVGPSFVPSGDIAEDMDRIRAFYDGIEGMHRDRKTAVRLREEMVVTPEPERISEPEMTRVPLRRQPSVVAEP